MPAPQTPSIASLVRQRVTSQGDSYWQTKDFTDLSAPNAVTKALARLAKDDTLKRVSKGIYYHPKPTRFGPSHPTQAGLHRLLKDYYICPAGLSAANLLGFTTQNVPAGEFATTARSIPARILGPKAKLHVNRPKTWEELSSKEAAILDIIRCVGQSSDLSPEETKTLLISHIKAENCFPKLLKVSAQEPPYVRAILGAIGQEIEVHFSLLEQLRETINPLTRFNFGKLHTLSYASQWQAK